MYYIGTVPCIPSDELAHFGIPGMKWGVRRFQNKDGSLTNQGQARYAKIFNDVIGKGSSSERRGLFTHTYSKGKPLYDAGNKLAKVGDINKHMMANGTEVKNVGRFAKNQIAPNQGRFGKAVSTASKNIKSGSQAAIFTGNAADYVKRTEAIARRNRNIAIGVIAGTAAVVAGAIIAKKIIDKRRAEKQAKEDK